MNALHRDVHASLKDLSEALGITSRYLSHTRFLLTIPVCFESLTWQVSFTRAGASHTCADLLVPDAHFAPLLRSEKVLAACLSADDIQHKGLTRYVKELLIWWAIYRCLVFQDRVHQCGKKKVKEGEGLFELITEFILVSLLSLIDSCSYEEHQRCLMDQLAMPGTALRFEVDTVFRAVDVKTQTLCMPTQALFVVTLYRSTELYHLEASLAPLGIGLAELREMEQEIKLRMVFPLPVSHLHSAPSRQLHIPKRLEELTGAVELPAWPAGKMCTLEYLPMVKEVFEESLRRAARAHSLRWEFFRALSRTKLGPPIELEEASHSTATFDIVSEECPLLLMIDLPGAFPQQKPRLTLQAGQAVPATGIQDYEWDPAWPAAEMANHVYAAVRQAAIAPC